PVRPLEDLLDERIVMGGRDEEPRPVGTDALVLLEAERDPVRARAGAALAHPGLLHGRVLRVERVQHARDPFVDLAEEALHPRSARLMLAHVDRVHCAASLLVLVEPGCRRRAWLLRRRDTEKRVSGAGTWPAAIGG